MKRVLIALWGIVGLLFGCAEKVSLTGPDASQQDAANDTRSSSDAFQTACGEDLGPCNPVSNGGCFSNERCFVPVGTIPSRCGATGTGGWGAPCADSSECRAGFACSRSPSGSGSRCVKLCCAGDDESCRDSATGGQRGGVCTRTLPLGLYGCDLPCDPFSTSNSCPTDSPYCGLDQSGAFRCNPQSLTPPRNVGESCTVAEDCRPGSLCNLNTNRCAATCNPNVLPDSCIPLHCMPVPMFSNIGFCQ